MPKLLNFKWKNTMDPEFLAFEHPLFVTDNDVNVYLIGFGFLVLCLLLIPLTVYLVRRAIRERRKKLLRDAPRFHSVTQKIRKSNPLFIHFESIVGLTKVSHMKISTRDDFIGKIQ